MRGCAGGLAADITLPLKEGVLVAAVAVLGRRNRVPVRAFLLLLISDSSWCSSLEPEIR